MRTVAWPSHAAVIALSLHVAGVGVCGAAGTSRPNSSTRSRRNLAGNDDDRLTQPAPTLAANPPATNFRRPTPSLFTGTRPSSSHDPQGGRPTFNRVS